MRRPVAAAAAVLLSAATCAGCSGSGSHATASGSVPANAVPGRTADLTATHATRWWSNSAARSGSVIPATNPLAVAGQLHPSRTDYCGMLRQTVSAGHSILPGVTATDPALLTSTKAFVGELQHVAPTAVSRPWQTLGDAVLTLVASGGRTSRSTTTDAAAVQHASVAIASDALHNCGVNLAATAKR